MLGELLQARRIGVIFLVAKDGAWGKLKIREGSIESLTFHSFKGADALPLLKKQHEIQFLFQEQRADSLKLTNSIDSLITNNEFFGFFGMSINIEPRENDAWDFDLDYPDNSVRPLSNKPKILVVDDSSTARKSARMVLEKAGYQVAEAKDGFEALGQLQNENPQLILLDLIMPGIDGYRVLDMIRGNPKFKDLPILMLTSRDGMLDKIKGAASSLNEYLTKPFVPENLVKIISKYIS